MPKGVIEIIFNFGSGDPVQAIVSHEKGNLPACFINGYNTSTLRLSLPDHQEFFGISLKPVAVRTLLGVPAGEFCNRVIDMELVDKVVGRLWLQLAEQDSFERRVAAVSTWLAGKVSFSQARDRLTNSFLTSNNGHPLSVPELAQHLCYSSRQLLRKMIEYTGMNTEALLHYKKYLRSVQLIHHSNLSLTQIAYQCRFADQSHFIKSFKSFTDMTPGEYRACKGQVMGHIFENVR